MASEVTHRIVVAVNGDFGREVSEADAAFIAALNPLVASALLDVCEAARQMFTLMTTPPDERAFKDDAELLAAASDPADPRWNAEDAAFTTMRAALSRLYTALGEDRKRE